MKTHINNKKLIKQLCVLAVLVLVMGSAGYWFFGLYSPKQHDQKLIQNMLAVTKSVEESAKQTLATPTALDQIKVNSTKDIAYFPAVQSYEYFVCGTFQKASAGSGSISEFDGQKTFEAAVAKAKKSQVTFDALTAVLLNGDKMQALHKKGTNCFFFESPTVRYAYDHPEEKCGGRYVYFGQKIEVVGVVNTGSPYMLADTNPMIQYSKRPISVNQEDIERFDLSRTKIVDVNCVPKTATDLRDYDFVTIFFAEKEDSKNKMPALLEITQHFN